MPLHVLGVRHHGPGSARSVRAALDELRPDVVVIEGAPELDGVAWLAGLPDMVPPVAGLVFALDQPSRAAFYPLAVFSPEWVALTWALAHGIPVRFADLSAAVSFGIAAQEDSAIAEAASDPNAVPGGDEAPDPAAVPVRAPRQDPIALLAAAAGYSDPERWWEDSIEHRADSAVARFAAVTEGMRLVREAHPERNDLENQRREAAMRTVLRAVLGEHDTVAMVCGAFHAPALEASAFPSKAADAKTLARLPKVKVGVTWAPWTNGRLRLASGYGAGVSAPGWYQHLFSTPTGDDVLTSWVVKVARALRAQQLDAAPASAVETVRLAEALAAVRGRPSAGLEELDDAAVAVLCEGSEERLQLIRPELFVGEVLGQVPDQSPMVPLAVDLARTQKSLRLSPKASLSTVQLDLRQAPQQARSVLFHRLRLLGINWAEPAASGRTTGTFKEAWDLQWRPELTVAVIEASVYGTTIETATTTRLTELAQTASLPELGRLVETCLLAEVPDALARVVTRLGEQTARSHDLRELLGSIEPLARTVRYGSVRGYDADAVLELLRVVVTRASVGLNAGCQALDDDLADATRTHLDAAHRGIQLLEDAALAEPWWAALMALDPHVHGSVGGRVDRLLLDAGRLGDDESAARMSRRLSVGASVVDSAAWLDGFLTGDAVLLLHDQALLRILDEWVAGVAEDTFEDLLPLVRRTFSRFSVPERRQLGDRLQTLPQNGIHGFGTGAAQVGDDDPSAMGDVSRAWPAIVTTAGLLGLEVTA